MKYCLIGEKLGHSYSKIIHESLGLNYSLRELKACELEEFFNTCNYAGFNVTIPYKKAVIERLNGVSPLAKDIGVVNTVVCKNGEFYGYNTDIGGMEYMIKRKGVSLNGKNVLILGSGGTSLTATYLCKKQNAKNVKVVSRTGLINYENCYELQETNVIINTTPVGMSPNVFDKPIELKKFKNLIAVFDACYNPKNTMLIQEAKSLNITCDSGISMLVKQALLARDIWLGLDSDDALTERIIKKLNADSLNIVLAGMPSCGKSTIGKKLAKTLNKNFIDVDSEIEKVTGKTPSQIITKNGEIYFRDIESEVIKNLALVKGSVISLGGGSVLRKENVLNLKLNGVICYIERDLNLLETKDRPLSQNSGIQTLYNNRKGVYNSVCDFKIVNDTTIENAVKEIIIKYENSCN